MKFEDTKLLDHPTVRQAFQALTETFKESQAFYAYAIQAAEIISTTVSHPDPDTVAAAIDMPPDVTATISPQAGDYAEQWLATLDHANAKPASEAVRQIVLAHAVIRLREVQEKIRARHYLGAKDVQYWIDKDAKPAQAVAAETQDQALVQLALAEVRTADDLVKVWTDEVKAAAVFEKQGLPDHPTLRAAYALIRAQETSSNSIGRAQSAYGAGTARILYETGASTDPDVLGAAILNQYGQRVPARLLRAFDKARSSADMDKAAARIDHYKATHPDPIEKKFSARLVGIYREISPLYHNKKQQPKSAEAQMIRHATYTYILEKALARFAEQKKNHRGHDAYYSALEHIEDYAFTLKSVAASETHPGLKARMEAALAAAEKTLNAPANVKTRKPGSPHLDGGW